MNASLIAAQNIQLQQKLLEQSHEIALWKKNYETLAQKYNELVRQKAYIQDLQKLNELKDLVPHLQEKEFKLSEQVMLISAENSRLHQRILSLQEENDSLQLQIGKFEALKSQYATLQRASQKLHSELEELRAKPPQIYVHNPNVLIMQCEIDRLNALIKRLCEAKTHSN